MKDYRKISELKERVTDEYRNEFLQFLETMRNKIRISDLEKMSVDYATKAKAAQTQASGSENKTN